MTDARKTLELTVAHQQRKLDEAEWNLLLAQQFGHMMLKAFNALQTHSVDYRKLRTYKLWPALTPTEGFTGGKAREKIALWITQIDNDIDAAIRRTSMKKVVDNKEDPYA